MNRYWILAFTGPILMSSMRANPEEPNSKGGHAWERIVYPSVPWKQGERVRVILSNQGEPWFSLQLIFGGYDVDEDFRFHELEMLKLRGGTGLFSGWF